MPLLLNCFFKVSWVLEANLKEFGQKYTSIFTWINISQYNKIGVAHLGSNFSTFCSLISIKLSVIKTSFQPKVAEWTRDLFLKTFQTKCPVKYLVVRLLKTSYSFRTFFSSESYTGPRQRSHHSRIFIGLPDNKFSFVCALHSRGELK